MRNKIILTEEDITNLITEAVDSVINEEDNNAILMGIAEQITALGEIHCNLGENELYDQIQIGEYSVNINYTVESESYWTGVGDPGDYIHEPQQPDFNEGETRVTVNDIQVDNEESDDVIDIEDNGIIANALKSVIVFDETDLPDRSFEYDEPDEY